MDKDKKKSWIDRLIGAIAGAALVFLLNSIFQTGTDKIKDFIYTSRYHNEIHKFQSARLMFKEADRLMEADPKLAMSLYTKSMSDLEDAAESGVVEAMHFYGEMLCVGRLDFFEQNKPKGISYLEKAFRNGAIEASVIANSCQF